MPDDSGGNSIQNKKNSTFIERLFKNKTQEEVQQEAEEEILSLVDRGKEKGIIENATKTLIENIFEFDDTVVSEIMTHRTEITAVRDTGSLNEIVSAAIESGHSRIPVYHGDIDNIIGVLHVKDLLKYVCDDVPKDFKITDIIRSIIYVPKTKNCAVLFADMTKNKIQLAVVVDEYGGTEGLVTLEDLIEEILGNIQDEYDNEDETFKRISENRFTADGSSQIIDVEDLLEIELDCENCDTIAGYFLDKLGYVPKDNEKPVVETDNLKMTAIKIEDRRILQVEIEKIIKEEDDN